MIIIQYIHFANVVLNGNTKSLKAIETNLTQIDYYNQLIYN